MGISGRNQRGGNSHLSRTGCKSARTTCEKRGAELGRTQGTFLAIRYLMAVKLPTEVANEAVQRHEGLYLDRGRSSLRTCVGLSSDALCELGSAVCVRRRHRVRFSKFLRDRGHINRLGFAVPLRDIGWTNNQLEDCKPLGQR